MDLIDKLKELAGRIPALKDGGLVKTEEGTKNALVMPFLSALGYDVFNPSEVTPELHVDVGTKKGEWVDYAILKDKKPIIIVECKGFDADLNARHSSQLFRYFSVTPVRFGILTNGIIYRFYSDLLEQNKMDSAPFFIFDLTNFNEAGIEILKRFTKPAFDEAGNLSVASNLKYRRQFETISDVEQFIFISYSRANFEFVKKLQADLLNRGVNIWIDKIGLKAGTPAWEQALRDAIRQSNWILLIASPESRRSMYVRDEIAIAKLSKKPILPIWAEGTDWIDCIPLSLGSTQYIDMREGNYENGLAELIKTLANYDIIDDITPTEDLSKLVEIVSTMKLRLIYRIFTT